MSVTHTVVQKWTNHSAQKEDVWPKPGVVQARFDTHQGVHNYQFMQSTVISGVPLVYLLIKYCVLTSITAAKETKLAPLPSRRGWPQLVHPRSPYPFPVWERIPTQAHRDPFIALHIKSLPLQWYLTIFTYSEPSVHFLSVRDTGKTGHTWSWCVFISFQRVFVNASWKLTKGEAECFTLIFSVRQVSMLRVKYLCRSQNYMNSYDSISIKANKINILKQRY